jgi:hypothetical protein
MVIVQRLRTEWTKKSRGGNEAGVRNGVPESLPLPSFEPGAKIVVHEARFLESESFQCRDDVTEVQPGDAFELGAMRITLQQDGLAVTFAWSWTQAGAPERWPKKAFTLVAGQWGRLQYNGRFGPSTFDDDTWWYRKDVFNVALCESIDRNLFTRTDPDFSASFLAQLR